MSELNKEHPGIEWELVTGIVLAQGSEIERLKAENEKLRQANAWHEARIKHYYQKLAEAERLVDNLRGQE